MGRDDLAHVPAEDIQPRKMRPSEDQDLADDVSAREQQAKKKSPVSRVTDAGGAQAEAEEKTETDYDRAKQLGYTGDSCPECGSMTMIRNGTCQKCITCGSTTGCS